MKPLFSQKFAILTAENPRYESAEGGNAALEQEMKTKGLKFTPMKGKYGTSENSYLVENPNHRDVLSWGKKYGQDSVIVSDGGHHKMVYTNGAHEGLWHEGHSVSIHDKEPEDFYSTINLNNKPTHFTIDFDMDTKHGESFKKSNSPKHLIHFSTTPGLTTLDPEFQGTAGRHSPETKHGKPTHPRVYFYEEGTPTESVVTGGAKSKYIVKHPGHDKIIDIANDLENQQQAKQQWLQKPIGSMQDAYFKLLKDKGYLGFKNSASGLPNVVAMFHATPVHAEIPMPKDINVNKDWTEASVPMSLKKSDVKEAVEAIKGSAKVNEVLADAKPDMRSKILAALRKEKLAKMNGTGTPGAGGATPPMMRPPVPAAPASMAMSKADESESRMAKKDLKDIMEYAQALDKMVVESEDLEDWVDSKITVARQYLSDIAHYLSYENGQPTEELDKGDVISMKDRKVISTDAKPASKELITKQPKDAAEARTSHTKYLKQDAKFDRNRHGSLFDRGQADAFYGRPRSPHWYPQGTYNSPKISKLNEKEIAEYHAGYDSVEKDSSTPSNGLKTSGVIKPQEPKPSLVKTEELDKGDVVSMKDRKVISTDTQPASKELVAAQPKMPKIKRPPVLIQTVKMAKSDSKKAKFERCVMAVKKKSGDKVNPWAVCHASVDGKMEKADMSVKEQDKPTKGMPQAKQLKADADLEKIKEGAENVAKAADKKKSELSKSTGYFKQNPKTQLPEWHDPLKQQREDAAKEEAEVRPEHKMHIWAELERQHQMSQKPKVQKPKEELEKGDVVSMKDRKIISTDAKPASKKLVEKQSYEAIQQNTPQNRSKFSSVKIFGKHDMNRLMNENPDYVAKYVDSHSDLLSRGDIDNIVENMPNAAAYILKNHPLFQEHHVDQIVKNDPGSAAYYLSNHPLLKPHHIDYIVNNSPEDAEEYLSDNPYYQNKYKQKIAKTQKPKEELEKKFSLKGALAVGALGAASLSGGAHASPESDLHSKLSNLNVMGEYHTPKSGSKAVLKEPGQLKANPAHPQTSYMSESKDKAVSGRFHGPDAEKAKKLLADYESANKSEELEKGKNVRKQRETVFGGWKTSAGSPRREKQIAALADMIKRRFGLEAKRAPGKVAASGKVIDKPNFHDNVVEHIGNPDSLVHEVGHLYQYGKDMDSIDPRKEFKTKEQSLSDWQKDMDAHWGNLNVKHGYKKQAQTAEEYEPTALENYYRRRAGLPTHQKTASTEEENRIESEKRGKKYKKPEISRTQAVDDPSKEIVQKVKVKGKDGQEKEIWLTGSMKNLTNKTRELVDQIDRGELALDPTRGFVEGTSVDAKINRRARAASQDKTRKDANTLMRSASDGIKKKLTLIQGENKPSKATKKATPEEHKAIMDKLNAALDTIKVDTSPEATKERKMLLEHVKHKLKGQK